MKALFSPVAAVILLCAVTGCMTPNVYTSIAEGRADVLRAALEKKPALADRKWRSYPSPLHYAAELGNEAACKVLLDNGADTQLADNRSGTPLHIAAGCGHASICELLLDKGADVDAPAVADGATPLHWAVVRGEAEVCALLLKSGANVNKRTLNGDTALYHAARFAKQDLCSLLVKGGADVNAKNRAGRTALMAVPQPHEFYWYYDPPGASRQSELDVVAKAMKDATSTFPMLARMEPDDIIKNGDVYILRSYEGHAEVAQLLLDAGADVACKDVNGWTPLLLAAAARNYEICGLLLGKGADASVTVSAGKPGFVQKKRTAVELAIEKYEGDPAAAVAAVKDRDDRFYRTLRVLVKHGCPLPRAYQERYRLRWPKP